MVAPTEHTAKEKMMRAIKSKHCWLSKYVQLDNFQRKYLLKHIDEIVLEAGDEIQKGTMPSQSFVKVIKRKLAEWEE